MDTSLPAISWMGPEELEARLPYAAVTDALKQAFDGSVTAPPRHIHTLGAESNADAAQARLLGIMPAWRGDGFFGVKLFTYLASNSQRGLPLVSSVYVAFDGVTGRPSALLDGGTLTNIRTACVSALAGRYLARSNSRVLLLVGTGELAPHLARAHASVQRLERILVWGRRPEAALRTVQFLRGKSLDAQAVSSIEEGLRCADIVSCATASQEPLVKLSQVRPGTHVDLVGGFTPQMREADDDLVAHARVVLETVAGVAGTAGDIAGPLSTGAIRLDALVELNDVITGRVAGRRNDAEITLFKTVGDAREDLCAAQLAVAAGK